MLWHRQLGGWVWAPITIGRGVGFVAVDTALEAFDVATGRILAQFPTSGTITSGATLADGRIILGSGLSYFGTRPGRTLYALRYTRLPKHGEAWTSRRRSGASYVAPGWAARGDVSSTHPTGAGSPVPSSALRAGIAGTWSGPCPTSNRSPDLPRAAINMPQTITSTP